MGVGILDSIVRVGFIKRVSPKEESKEVRAGDTWYLWGDVPSTGDSQSVHSKDLGPVLSCRRVSRCGVGTELRVGGGESAVGDAGERDKKMQSTVRALAFYSE